MKRLTALMALALLTACDYVERLDFERERADDLYKSAMEDYQSGRVEAALEGFKKAVRKDPSNASARFQYACLLQDVKTDYRGAFCAYQEYLSQHPESDKAKLAMDRLEKCEFEFAKLLASKYKLSEKDAFVKENEALRGDLRSSEMRVATLEKEAGSLRSRVTSLVAERERLFSVIKGDNLGEGFVASVPRVREAKDLLEEEDELDRIKMSADVAALRADASEELSDRSLILPVSTGAVTRVVKKKEEAKKESRQIPETYVVQEGDTLYGLSKRFYGRLSAWKNIREMNKALISADNRLHVGDTLKLPQQ